MSKAIPVSAADARAVRDGCYFDMPAAQRVRRFFSGYLRHSLGEWAGRPFELLPWEWEGVIAPLFGWRTRDGRRRYKSASIWVPKKNGKTTIAAGIAAYMLAGDCEPGAEVYLAAVTREQAGIAFRQASHMVRASPPLAESMTVLETSKRITYEDGFIRALASEAGPAQGLNASAVIVDELHEWRKRDYYDSLIYSGIARRQPLFLTISTAGSGRDRLGWEQYQYARGILDGTIDDPTHLAYIAGAADDDDWTSPEVWERVNPSWGVTVREDEIREACERARSSPRYENAFRRFRLNQWTEQVDRWIALEAWDECPSEPPIELAGQPCFAAIDLSATRDLTARALVFPLGGGEYALKLRFWAPAREAYSYRDEQQREQLRQWARQGHITLCPGEAVDYAMVAADMRACAAEYRVQQVAMDPWNAQQVARELEAEGLRVVAFRQGLASMSPASKEFERAVSARKVYNFSNPVLRWMVSNVATRGDDNDNIMPCKGRSGDRIDGVVAAIMGIGLATAQAIEPESPYLHGGPVFV